MSLERIVSGGQTGVDRAALDVALEDGVPCGGWCPRGRRAEDGVIDARYPLEQTPAVDDAVRTEWNVRDSDGTLILTVGPLTGGTALTESFARRLGKPCWVIDLQQSADVGPVADWLAAATINILNVAGPRESTQPGIYQQSVEFLRDVLNKVSGDGRMCPDTQSKIS